MPDEARFRGLWVRLGGRGEAAETFASLIASYSAPDRYYHNIAHIRDCLRQFDLVRSEAERPDEVEAAIWYHDAVYDTHAADNEERSAALATDTLLASQVPSEVVGHIAELILTTKHDREPATPDGLLLVNVDLAILGADPDAFDAYDRAIREEYSWVADVTYRAGRSKVLKAFLDRPVIYRLPFFNERYETPARANLVRAISRLA